MKRRGFLQLLGIAPALPAIAKGALSEAPPQPLLVPIETPDVFYGGQRDYYATCSFMPHFSHSSLSCLPAFSWERDK